MTNEYDKIQELDKLRTQGEWYIVQSYEGNGNLDYWDIRWSDIGENVLDGCYGIDTVNFIALAPTMARLLREQKAKLKEILGDAIDTIEMETLEEKHGCYTLFNTCEMEQLLMRLEQALKELRGNNE